ncbi:MAG: threonylcarbamoyl-AMP synthase [Lachnospiraceae bacterium]|nr:threonylcarbamoyl-AMP synthase [Lachnospiraceae bacterium]
METKVVAIDSNNIDETIINEAGLIIKRGGLVAFPTETVYGLGGDGLNPESSKKIYAAKGRPSDNPLIIHIADIKDLEKIVKAIPESAMKLVDRFWPGPLTMIFEKSEAVPLETTGGLETVAVRMPSDKVARAFIKAAGGYVAAPSANLSGRPSPTLAKYVIEDMNGRIEMIIDGGASKVGLESTIVDTTTDRPMILRPGYITQEMLEDALREEVLWDRAIIDEDCKTPPKAPGMKYRHYAPKASLTIVEGLEGQVAEKINSLGLEAVNFGKKVGVIATEQTIGLYNSLFNIKSAGSKENADDAAHFLFKILREFDDDETEIIFSESFEGDGVGKATMNRLIKAAGHQIIQA